MTFDGRSRECRKELEKTMEIRRHFCELWIVYLATMRLGRKVSFGSDNKEVCYLSLPLSRAKLSCQLRETYNSSGEESTHSTTYSGVAGLPWGACPKLQRADKQAIFSVEPAEPSNKLFDCNLGMPLYWQERKDAKIWTQLVKNVNGKAVFDVSPGSGQLARACLALDIQYTGMARNPMHAQFLDRMLDRYAMEEVTKQKSAFHDAGIAVLVKTHFQDVVDLVIQEGLTADSEFLEPEGEDI